MAFVSDTVTLSRVSADLFNMTLGKANVREGTIDSALAISEWPRDLDLLIVDIGDAGDPVADAAALKTAVPGTCLVIGVGRINDVALYRDLLAVGFNDYLAMPFAEGTMGRAVERAMEVRERTGGSDRAARRWRAKDAKPRTLSVIGARGGVGTTTAAVTIAAMLGARLQEEVLLIDFDLHYGSLMLALDLEAIDALREALDQPDRIDALFIQQVAQKKSEYLYAMGAEEPPTGGFQARPHAASDFLRSFHRRFRWIVADVPRGDPVIQRQVIEASSDILLITDLSPAGRARRHAPAADGPRGGARRQAAHRHQRRGRCPALGGQGGRRRAHAEAQGRLPDPGRCRRGAGGDQLRQAVVGGRAQQRHRQGAAAAGRRPRFAGRRQRRGERRPEGVGTVRPVRPGPEEEVAAMFGRLGKQPQDAPSRAGRAARPHRPAHVGRGADRAGCGAGRPGGAPGVGRRGA